MSKILVDELVNLAGTDKVTFAEGLKVSNGETIELDGATITLDTGVGLNDQLLASTGAGLKWVTFTNTNTTYDFAASGAAVNDVRLRLTAGGSGSGTDEVVLQGAGDTTVNLSGNVITVSSTDANTTYDFTSAAVTSGVAFQLVGNDSTTDAVNLLEGSNINISRSGNDITISTILSGTVTGPSSATDGAVVLFDGTAGNLLKDSTLTVDAGGNLTTAGAITTASGTASLITFRYDQTGSFPNANSYQGALAYSDNNNAMYFASGNSWYQLARLTDIVPNTDTTYSIGLTGTSFGLLTLTDSNGITDSVEFYRNVYGSIQLERSGEELYFDGRVYDLSAVTGGGNAATLRLTGLNHDTAGSITNTTTDDISFAGANGITVTRTDANTITIDGTGAGGGTSYTDSDAKDAAAQSILNGTHLGISFTYDQSSQVLNSIVTASGTGGGSTAILYDFFGSNTTSNQVVLNLDPSTGTTDTVEFAGAGATTISWDSLNKKATVSTPIPSVSSLSDTNLISPTGGDLLAYDSVNSQWINAPDANGVTTYRAAYFYDTVEMEQLNSNSVLIMSGYQGNEFKIMLNGSTGQTGQVLASVGDDGGGYGTGLDWITLTPGNYTLPTADATTLGGIKIGSGLEIDAGGVVTVTASGATGLGTRAALTDATNSIADGVTANLNISGYKAYTLLKIETDVDAWVRVYTDDAARTADSIRSEGTDPLPGDGVIAEVRGVGPYQLSPAPVGYNNDFPSVTSTIYLAVTNRSGTTQPINVTLTAIRLEA